MGKIVNITVPASSTDTSVQIDIPVATLAIDGTGTVKVTQADPVITQTGGTTPAPPEANFSLPVIPLSDPDFVAPMRGANTFYNSKQTCPIPNDSNPWAYDNEKRFTWNELQPSQAGVYNWTNFDAAVNSSIDKGQKFSFGIMPIEQSSGTGATVGGGLCCYPLYLHTAMQAEATKDWLSNDSTPNLWVPNWNSNTYLTAWESFLLALAAHIRTAAPYKGISYTAVISKVNILGFGNWGEWHTSGAGRGKEPAGTKATAASLLRIARAHATAFPNNWLVSVVNAFVSESYPEVAYYLLTATNTVGRFGWSNYHLGSTAIYYPGYAENNNWTYNGVALKDLIMNQWKFAPIAGEPMNNQSEVTLNGQVFGDILRQVQLYHVSQFNNQTNYPAAPESTLNLRAASKASGYRIQITGGSIAGRVLTLNWTNAGLAPVYENWEVWLLCGTTLVKSTMNLRALLPGNAVSNDTLPVGSYNLWVIIKDPVGYRKPLPLANPNRLTDGSYLIGAIVSA